MHAGEGGEARPLTSSKSNKSTSPSCVRMWTVGKCGKRAWELVCVGVRVTGGRQGRGRLAEEIPFACLRTIIALVKLTSQEASMDVVQGFVLTAAAPCTGLCAGRRKSLKPFGRGVYAKRVLRVRPMHLPRGLAWRSPSSFQSASLFRGYLCQKVVGIFPRNVVGNPRNAENLAQATTRRVG